MGKRKLVNWTPRDKSWVKQYKGTKYYLCSGRCKTDRESYNLAVKKLKEIIRKVDGGEEVTSTRNILPETKKKSKKKKTRKWNPRRVSTVVRKFLKDKMHEAVSSNGEDISFGRVQNLKNRLQHFVDYFGDELLSQISSSDLSKWSRANAKRVEQGVIKPSTLRQDYRAVRQLYKYAYTQEIINTLPRTLDALGRQSKANKKKLKKVKRYLFFSNEEIQKLYKGCSKENLNSKWSKRDDTEIELLKLAIVLSLNTGMTQQDLSDLTVGELYLKKRPPRCIRQRSKTGEDSNHLLWRESVRLFKKHLSGKSMGDKVLLRSDGRHLVVDSVVNGKKTGGRSDVLGAAFTRLVKRIFGKDDPRRFRELRRTSADRCKNRMAGTETLFLSHSDGQMSSFYTRPAQQRFDLMMTYLEVDYGFADKVIKLPKSRESK